MNRKIIILLIAAIVVVTAVTLLTVLIGKVMSLFSQNSLPAAAQTGEVQTGDVRTGETESGTDYGASLHAPPASDLHTDDTSDGRPAVSDKGASGTKGDNPPSSGTYTVIVDPGHGFTDEGCSSEFIGELTEKELTLAMAEELRTILEGYGVNVIMLHDGKSFPSLPKLTALADSYSIEYDIAKCVDNNIFSAYERTVYANYLSKVNDVDLYISIHVNAMENNPDYSGFEIDYCAENESSAVSKIFFDSIIDAIKSNYPSEKLYTWEDSWEKAFIVTKYTSVPSVLFETGFATNAGDAARLTDRAERRKLMQTVADGIAGALEAAENAAKLRK
ncbi:MAG: N-acetylmuramoyl-L-alanine amidase [Clostridia bacterium]|nr:N-acetylmuramoyl-L-alanine amidase [Clostridia bacterium]